MPERQYQTGDVGKLNPFAATEKGKAIERKACRVMGAAYAIRPYLEQSVQPDYRLICRHCGAEWWPYLGRSQRGCNCK